MNYNILLDSARQFRGVVSRCIEIRQKTHEKEYPSFPIPANVNYGLSVELYLKYLLFKQGVTKKEHNIKTLFYLLKKETQQEIINSITPIPLLNFDYLINTHAKIFEQWRYLFEIKKSTGTVYFSFLDDLTNAIEKIIERDYS